MAGFTGSGITIPDVATKQMSLEELAPLIEQVCNLHDPEVRLAVGALNSQLEKYKRSVAWYSSGHYGLQVRLK